MDKENSAGGVVFKDENVLLVLMKTLSGSEVWTFPKGHIEEGEKPQEAALREVFEETGVRCLIIDDNEFFVNSYSFIRDHKNIFKTVKWYLMKPVEETGKILTPEEIKDVKWVSISDAKKLLSYESDKKMVDLLLKRMEEKNGV